MLMIDVLGGVAVLVDSVERETIFIAGVDGVTFAQRTTVDYDVYDLSDVEDVIDLLCLLA